MLKIQGLEVQYDKVPNHKGVLVFIMSFSITAKFCVDSTIAGKRSNCRQIALDSNYSVLTIELPGMGESEFKKDDYLIDDFRNDVYFIFKYFSIKINDVIFFSTSGAAKICFLLSTVFKNKLNVFCTIGEWPTRTKLVLTHYGLHLSIDTVTNALFDSIGEKNTPDLYPSKNAIFESLLPAFNEDGNVAIPLVLYNDAYKRLFYEEYDPPTVKTIILIGDADHTENIKSSPTTQKVITSKMKATKEIIVPKMSHFWTTTYNKDEVFLEIIKVIDSEL